MHDDFLLRAATFIARVNESSPNAHAIKIRYAHMAKRILDDFIADEAKMANGQPQDSDAFMSWADVGKTLGISRSAAYARYGGRDERK